MGAVVSELAERDTKQLELYKTIETWLFGPGYNSTSEETLSTYFFVLAFNPKTDRLFPWKNYLLIITSHRIILAKEKNKDLALKAVIQYNDITEMFFAPDFQLVKISLADKTCAYLNTAQKSLAPEVVKIITANIERFKGEESACGQRAKLPLPVGVNPHGLNANEKKELGKGVYGISLPSASPLSARSHNRDESKAARLINKNDEKRRSVKNILTGGFLERQQSPGRKEGPPQLTRVVSTLGMNRSAALLLTTHMAHLTPVFKILQSLNLQEPQLYSGQVDLLAVITTLRARTDLPVEDRTSYLIDFSFPDDEVFGGLQKRLYKVSNKSTSKQTLSLLCNKLKIADGSNKFSLCTDAGRLLDDSKTLADYGLGILFLTWQLRIIAKPAVPVNYIIDLQLPEGPQFLGQQKKSIKIKNTAKISEVVPLLFEKLKLPNAKEYELKTMEYLELDPEDLLGEHATEETKFSFIIVKAGQKPQRIPSEANQGDQSPRCSPSTSPVVAPTPYKPVSVSSGIRTSSFISGFNQGNPVRKGSAEQPPEALKASDPTEATLRAKIEAEVRASIEVELRRKIEAELRKTLEKEVKDNIEKQILAKIDETTKKLSSPPSTSPSIPQRRSVVLGGNRASMTIQRETAQAQLSQGQISTTPPATQPTTTPPATTTPPTTQPTATPLTTPTTTSLVPPLSLPSSGRSMSAPEAPLSEEQQKINKLVERMTALSQEKREEIANMLMLFESEDKAKEEVVSTHNRSLTFIKMRTFGQLKGHLGEGRGNLKTVSVPDRPLLQEDNQFIKMLMKRYESVHINPDDVEDLASSDEDW